MLPRTTPPDPDVLKLELSALTDLAERQMCRFEDRRFLRLLLDDFIAGSEVWCDWLVLSWCSRCCQEWPKDDALYAARNQVLRCLYGLVPLKSHECRLNKADMNKPSVMAEAFRHIKEITSDPLLSQLMKKIHSHFSAMPSEEMAARFAQIEAVFQGQSDSLPGDEYVKHPEYADVYADLHYNSILPSIKVQ
jgi:hypothetical protein